MCSSDDSQGLCLLVFQAEISGTGHTYIHTPLMCLRRAKHAAGGVRISMQQERGASLPVVAIVQTHVSIRTNPPAACFLSLL